MANYSKTINNQVFSEAVAFVPYIQQKGVKYKEIKTPEPELKEIESFIYDKGDRPVDLVTPTNMKLW